MIPSMSVHFHSHSINKISHSSTYPIECAEYFIGFFFILWFEAKCSELFLH